MEDHNGPRLDLSHTALDIFTMNLGSMPLRDRFTCALVCKAWAKAATAATRSIILRDRHSEQDFSSLQTWLEKHGDQLEVLQLHACYNAALAALPCCAKLHDLLLQGKFVQIRYGLSIASRTWGDIASATKLTSVSLKFVQTASQQADVVAALTALPNLEQLTWHQVCCSNEYKLSDSLLLQQMTQLTSLKLHYATADALQHLGSLTKLQHLSISDADDWAIAGCPGLQELTALTSLKLACKDLNDLPVSIRQLTALRQLEVCRATPSALDQLQVLTGLAQLCVRDMTGLSPESPPLKLQGLQHLELLSDSDPIMPMSYLASCTQLQHLKLGHLHPKGPGSLVASTMLQHLELECCIMIAADGAADPAPWQQVFPGPGQLRHLTSLQLFEEQPALHQADIEGVVACCSNLRVLGLVTFPSSFAPALARLPGLTSLQLHLANDVECSAIAQLTGLRQLTVMDPWQMSAVALRHLAALQQLTSLGLDNFGGSRQLYPLVELFMRDSLPTCMPALINKVCAGPFLSVCVVVVVVCVFPVVCV